MGLPDGWQSSGPLLCLAALPGLFGLGIGIYLARELARCRAELSKLGDSKPRLPAKQQAKPKVRPPVAITAEDRIPPGRPTICPLRGGADPRADPAALIRCDPHPDRRSGAAVLILPGGNYDGCRLAMPLQVAAWLADLGIVAFILRYRLRSEGHYWPAQEEDCRDAVSYIRAQLDGKLGVMGFSAGGHLASWAATTFDGTLRPDFHMLIYATTNVETPVWDPWKARLGHPGPEFNTFDKVSEKTPPLFIAVSKDDDITSYEENTHPYLQSCKRSGVPAELVLESMGPHGHPMLDLWTKPCERWLRKNGWACGA